MTWYGSLSKRRNGATFPLHLSVGEMIVEGKRSFTGILHDLSIRTAMEAALRKSEERLRSIVESAVDGITGVRKGQSLREAGTNLTVIVQGTNRIFGTLGDSRCTVDSLTQRKLEAPDAYRVEARGFCTQPAHAVRGDGEVLVSTFEFAGLVNYQSQ